MKPHLNSADGPADKPPSGPLRQRSVDLGTLYRDAEAAQEHLNQATRDIARRVGGEPLIPSTLKAHGRALEKIAADYGGDAARVTDLARSSIVCDIPQQVYRALDELKSLFKVVRVKDRFQKPLNGYRDMLVNVEMPNGHIVEVQLHSRSIMEVKHGVGHQLYEQTRAIFAKAKTKGRPLTLQEETTISGLERQMEEAYNEAFERSTRSDKN